MTRIAYRAVVLVISLIICAGLIGARPLPLGKDQSHGAGVAEAPPAPPKDLAASYPARIHELAPPLGKTFHRRVVPAVVGASAAPAKAERPVMPVPGPRQIAGEGPWMRGTLVTRTERLDLYVGKQTFSAEQIADLAPLIEQLLRRAERRFGTTLESRVSIAFYQPALAPQRGVRGLAYTDTGRAELYYRPYENTTRAAAIAAHELAHHLEAQRYGNEVQRRADTILHEGMATWIAGDGWLPMCGASTWKQRARQLRNAGIPMRLLTAEESGANNAYEMWASFVDFLAVRYGWERLDALYESGRGRAPGSANYQKVLGKSLDELADEWRAWIDE